MDLPYWIKLLSNTAPTSKCLKHDTIVFQLVMSIYTHLILPHSYFGEYTSTKNPQLEKHVYKNHVDSVTQLLFVVTL